VVTIPAASAMSRVTMTSRPIPGLSLCALVLLGGCARAPDPAPAASITPAASPPAAVPPAAVAPARVAVAPPPVQAAKAPAPMRLDAYPWLADPAAVPPPVDALEQRFEAPSGFTRVELAAGTFGAWLRALPLARAGTPVLSFRGGVVLPADHENLAAVVALDVGAQDLQQCADSIIRLHGEWLYAQGRRDASYRAASGAAMPFTRWAHGERMVAAGLSFGWTQSARADEGHASYRRWLDAVFTYANTGSLARDAEPVASADLRPGDFVVQAGAPGHAVLVLDLARAPDGRRALLLGQGFMPAQSFQVLRPSPAGAWFVVDPSAQALDTPFWAPFPWKALRRFAGT
jgi:hypothetical protein